MRLTREADLAAQWDMTLEQIRALRRRHGWAHVQMSRQDIRYTDAQIEYIVVQMTVPAAAPPSLPRSGQTARSAARSRPTP